MILQLVFKDFLKDIPRIIGNNKMKHIFVFIFIFILVFFALEIYSVYSTMANNANNQYRLYQNQLQLTEQGPKPFLKKLIASA
jgi:hypothetical protein